MPSESGLTRWESCGYSITGDFHDGHGVPQIDFQIFGCSNPEILKTVSQKEHYFGEGLVERIAILTIGRHREKPVEEALSRVCGPCFFYQSKDFVSQQPTS